MNHQSRPRGRRAGAGPRPGVGAMETTARYRDLIHEGARFCVVGAGGVVVTDGTNLLRAVTRLGWLNASVLATVADIAVTYVGSRYWTFRHRPRTGIALATAFLVPGLPPAGLASGRAQTGPRRVRRSARPGGAGCRC